MTRETKIGLLLGMGVIILIGILVSDHLSVAGKQYQAPLVQPLPEVGDPVAEGMVLTDPSATRREPTTLRRLLLPEDFTTPGAPQDLSADRGTGFVGTQVIGNGTKVPVQAITAQGTPSPVMHQVQAGQTLHSIARRYYNDTKSVALILQANPSVRNPDRLRPGLRLVIPLKPGAATSGLTGAQVTHPVPDPATVAYKVGEGDTFSSLAQEYYGSGAQWEKLYALNKDRIKDPNRLRPGTEIRVPKK